MNLIYLILNELRYNSLNRYFNIKAKLSDIYNFKPINLQPFGYTISIINPDILTYLIFNKLISNYLDISS